MLNLKKKDIVYYVRVFPSLGIYDIYDCIVRTVAEDYFVVLDKHDKRAYLFNNSDYNKVIFSNRKEALKIVKEAEKHKVIVSSETYYEEY